MSATRLLVLGVVRMYGQAHGYQVRRELLSWNADQWGNVKPGSIYHALKKMTAEGLLAEVDTAQGGGPDKVSYRLTADGEHDFHDSLTTMLSDATHEVSRSGELEAAIVFMPTLPRKLAISLLRHRLTKIRGTRATLLDAGEHADEWQQPQHVQALYRMWSRQVDAQVAWMEDQVDRLERGELVMADDEGDSFGTPPERISSR